MRIEFVGDSHCDKSYWNRALHEAQYNKADCLWIVGDVCILVDGYMKLSTAAAAYNKNVFIIDGNHDDHDFLQSLSVSPQRFPWGEIVCAGIAPFLWYIPRGTGFEWDGKKFLAIGGAYSIDKGPRLERMSYGGQKEWWDQELIVDDDVEKAISSGKADIMVCHDAPNIVDLREPMNGYPVFPQTLANRERLDRVFDVAKPQILIHGHYHYSADREFAKPYESNGGLSWQSVRAISLGCNFDEDKKSMFLLNTEGI